MTNILTRAAIQEVQDLPQEIVPVPEWGGDVLARGLTGAERDAFEGDIISQNGKNMSLNTANMRAKLVARSVIDETGKRLFSDDDIQMLGTKSAVALQRIFDVAQRLSGMSEKDVKELSEALKNAPSAALPSA
jgi:hypothetical protein